MNNDRELLELAAKAAGIEINWFKWERLTNQWNPLTDDGDAATLEATLFLDVSWFKNSLQVNAMPSWMKWGISISEEFPVFSSTEEKKKAKRRAITRAAAAIAKATGENGSSWRYG
jgi:hypothetical protein